MTAESAPGLAFTLGDRLRKARMRAGLGQLELANKIAASRNTISNYENDHHGPRGPKKMTLRAWAHECGVSFEELTGGAATLGGAAPVAQRTRASDYGSRVGRFSPPVRRGRRRTDGRHLSVVCEAIPA